MKCNGSIEALTVAIVVADAADAPLLFAPRAFFAARGDGSFFRFVAFLEETAGAADAEADFTTSEAGALRFGGVCFFSSGAFRLCFCFCFCFCFLADSASTFSRFAGDAFLFAGDAFRFTGDTFVFAGGAFRFVGDAFLFAGDDAFAFPDFGVDAFFFLGSGFCFCFACTFAAIAALSAAASAFARPAAAFAFASAAMRSLATRASYAASAGRETLKADCTWRAESCSAALVRASTTENVPRRPSSSSVAPPDR